MSDPNPGRGATWSARLLAIGVFALLVGGAARLPITRTATINEQDAPEGAPLYQQVSRYERLPDGQTQATTEIRSKDQGLIARETATYRGTQISLQNYTDYLSGRRYRLERKDDGTLAFTAVPLSGEGAAEENTEKPDGCWTSVPVLEPFIREHWDELLSGKPVACSLVAIDQQDLHNFEFKAEASGKIDGKDAVLIRLKPSNVIVSMGMKPIQIFVDVRNGRFLRWVGRTPLLMRKGDELASFDAVVNFR
jgi:hypothetical protein